MTLGTIRRPTSTRTTWLDRGNDNINAKGTGHDTEYPKRLIVVTRLRRPDAVLVVLVSLEGVHDTPLDRRHYSQHADSTGNNAEHPKRLLARTRLLPVGPVLLPKVGTIVAHGVQRKHGAPPSSASQGGFRVFRRSLHRRIVQRLYSGRKPVSESHLNRPPGTGKAA